MSLSMTCSQCSSTFSAPIAAVDKPVVRPCCGATAAVAVRDDAASIRPPLTDDDVLGFLNLPTDRATSKTNA